MSRVRLLASGRRAGVLARLAPPACAEAGLLSEWEPDGKRGLRLVLPLSPGFLAGADRLIPSLSNTAAADYAFRFGLRVRSGGAMTPWVRLTRIGRAPEDPDLMPADVTGAGDPVGTDVDMFMLRVPVEGAELEVRVWTADPVAFRRAPCLLAVSAAGAPAPPVPPAGLADVGPIPVPALSQMVEAEAIRHRICSPTSVAMVLGALGVPATAAGVAAAAHLPRSTTATASGPRTSGRPRAAACSATSWRSIHGSAPASCWRAASRSSSPNRTAPAVCPARRCPRPTGTCSSCADCAGTARW